MSLTAGSSDPEQGDPWREDTLVHTYSTSKPFAALAALSAVGQGALGLDEPVAKYWHEYGRAGKEDSTLRQILTHRAGQPVFPPAAAAVDLVDEEALREVLAESPPETPPGTVVAEHALTYGHLIDGVLRAATGRPLGYWFNDIVRPVFSMDAWFGVQTADLSRALEHGLPGRAAQMLVEVCPTYERSLAVPHGAMDMSRINSTDFRQSTFAAINLHASARGLARFYSTITQVDGPLRELLGEQLHTEFVTTQVTAVDETIQERVNWTLGMFRTDNFIGMGGLGGSAAYWSFTNNHAVAYVTRRLHDHAVSGRSPSPLRQSHQGCVNESLAVGRWGHARVRPPYCRTHESRCAQFALSKAWRISFGIRPRSFTSYPLARAHSLTVFASAPTRVRCVLTPRVFFDGPPAAT